MLALIHTLIFLTKREQNADMAAEMNALRQRMREDEVAKGDAEKLLHKVNELTKSNNMLKQENEHLNKLQIERTQRIAVLSEQLEKLAKRLGLSSYEDVEDQARGNGNKSVPEKVPVR